MIISLNDLRAFLNFWPIFDHIAKELKLDLVINEQFLFTTIQTQFTWFNHYELPAIEHFLYGLNSIVDVNTEDIYNNFNHSLDRTASNRYSDNQSNLIIENRPSKENEQVEILLNNSSSIIPVCFSAYNSLKCLMYYGKFLNDLIEQAKQGSDHALFQAISIDPTCISCKPIVERLNMAIFIKDTDFLNDLKNKLGKKPETLAQENYKKMQVIFESLVECSASKLSDDALYKLFIGELGLYH